MPSIQVPRISLRDFEQRRETIKKELIDASEYIGFFTLIDHGIPKEVIEDGFTLSKEFFDLSDDVKGKTPHNGKNMGWEKNAQIRPSTGLPDMKESLQLQFARMEGMWPADEDVASFKARSLVLMRALQDLSVRVMQLFAEALELPEDTFTAGTVDPGLGDSQTALRLLKYHDITGQSFPANYWRGGSHTDFDCLTLLLQRRDQRGLEVCPGREVFTDFGTGNDWTAVEPDEEAIVCNIGDQLMRWSDDRLKSTFHRVRTPQVGENQADRYSIAFFNQARSNIMIQGPKQKYPPVSGAQFIQEALARNNLAKDLSTSAAPSSKAPVHLPSAPTVSAQA